MNRINPALFSAAFTAWVRETWPESSRARRHRRQDLAPQPRSRRGQGAAASGLRLRHHEPPRARPGGGRGKEPTSSPRSRSCSTGSPNGGLKGALVSIDAIATNAEIAQAITDAGADYLLAVKANQPTLRAEIESAFAAARRRSTRFVDLDKGHGRIEQRRVERPPRGRLARTATAAFPANCACRTPRRSSACNRAPSSPTAAASRPATTSPRPRSRAEQAAEAVRGHWGIENRLHWVLDVAFADDQSRLRKGHGARNSFSRRCVPGSTYPSLGACFGGALPTRDAIAPVRFGRILPASSMAAVTIRSTQLAALQIEFAGIASCFRGAAGFQAFDDDLSKGRTVSPSLATLNPSLDWRIV